MPSKSTGHRTDVRGFREALRRFERLIEVRLRDSGGCRGVSLAQCHALLEIEALGQPALNELAQSLGLDKSTLSRTVEGLVRLDLVTRASNAADRRSVQLSLTEKGLETCARINRENDALFTRVLARAERTGGGPVAAGFRMLVDSMAAEMKAGGLACFNPVPAKGKRK
jgi:DNA-binding MarR family transcriptional regulator